MAELKEEKDKADAAAAEVQADANAKATEIQQLKDKVPRCLHTLFPGFVCIRECRSSSTEDGVGRGGGRCGRLGLELVKRREQRGVGWGDCFVLGR